MRRSLGPFLAVLAACTPATSRPAFLPYPQALAGVVATRPARIVPELAGWLMSEGLKIEWASPLDGFVETAWFNTRTRQSSIGTGDPGDLQGTIKIRCWADPGPPGKTQVTVEAVYRPMLDPSRMERDLEVIVPEGSDGYRIAEQLLEAMQQRFGA